MWIKKLLSKCMSRSNAVNITSQVFKATPIFVNGNYWITGTLQLCIDELAVKQWHGDDDSSCYVINQNRHSMLCWCNGLRL